jgi:hypothetical protein
MKGMQWKAHDPTGEDEGTLNGTCLVVSFQSLSQQRLHPLDLTRHYLCRDKLHKLITTTGAARGGLVASDVMVAAVVEFWR